MHFEPVTFPRTGSCRASPWHHSGFSLLELIVTVVVIAVIASIAYPALLAVINGNRLAGAANEMVATLQLARSEAVRLNRSVTVCRSADGIVCTPGALWNTWIAITDANRDGKVDDVLRVVTLSPPLELRVSPAITGSRIAFRPDGLARTEDGRLLTASVAVCVPSISPADNVRRIQIGSGGRISTWSLGGGGQCDAPGDQ